MQFYERHDESKQHADERDVYTEADEMDLTYFILYNLTAMKTAYVDLKAYLERKINQQSSVVRFKNLPGINERQAQVLKMLSDNPSSVLTAKELATRFGVTVRTARMDLQTLVAEGFMVGTALNKRMIGYVRSDRFELLVKAENQGNQGK